MPGTRPPLWCQARGEPSGLRQLFALSAENRPTMPGGVTISRESLLGRLYSELSVPGDPSLIALVDTLVRLTGSDQFVQHHPSDRFEITMPDHSHRLLRYEELLQGLVERYYGHSHPPEYRERLYKTLLSATSLAESAIAGGGEILYCEEPPSWEPFVFPREAVTIVLVPSPSSEEGSRRAAGSPFSIWGHLPRREELHGEAVLVAVHQQGPSTVELVVKTIAPITHRFVDDPSTELRLPVYADSIRLTRRGGDFILQGFSYPRREEIEIPLSGDWVGDDSLIRNLGRIPPGSDRFQRLLYLSAAANALFLEGTADAPSFEFAPGELFLSSRFRGKVVSLFPLLSRSEPSLLGMIEIGATGLHTFSVAVPGRLRLVPSRSGDLPGGGSPKGDSGVVGESWEIDYEAITPWEGVTFTRSLQLHPSHPVVARWMSRVTGGSWGAASYPISEEQLKELVEAQRLSAEEIEVQRQARDWVDSNLADKIRETGSLHRAVLAIIYVDLEEGKKGPGGTGGGAGGGTDPEASPPPPWMLSGLRDSRPGAFLVEGDSPLGAPPKDGFVGGVTTSPGESGSSGGPLLPLVGRLITPGEEFTVPSGLVYRFSPVDQGALWLLPPDPDGVGLEGYRRDEIAEILSLLEGEEPVVAVAGWRGTGKSRIARETLPAALRGKGKKVATLKLSDEGVEGGELEQVSALMAGNPDILILDEAAIRPEEKVWHRLIPLAFLLHRYLEGGGRIVLFGGGDFLTPEEQAVWMRWTGWTPPLVRLDLKPFNRRQAHEFLIPPDSRLSPADQQAYVRLASQWVPPYPGLLRYVRLGPDIDHLEDLHLSLLFRFHPLDPWEREGVQVLAWPHGSPSFSDLSVTPVGYRRDDSEHRVRLLFLMTGRLLELLREETRRYPSDDGIGLTLAVAATEYNILGQMLAGAPDKGGSPNLGFEPMSAPEARLELRGYLSPLRGTRASETVVLVLGTEIRLLQKIFRETEECSEAEQIVQERIGILRQRLQETLASIQKIDQTAEVPASQEVADLDGTVGPMVNATALIVHRDFLRRLRREQKETAGQFNPLLDEAVFYTVGMIDQNVTPPFLKKDLTPQERRAYVYLNRRYLEYLDARMAEGPADPFDRFFPIALRGKIRRLVDDLSILTAIDQEPLPEGVLHLPDYGESLKLLVSLLPRHIEAVAQHRESPWALAIAQDAGLGRDVSSYLIVQRDHLARARRRLAALNRPPSGGGKGGGSLPGGNPAGGIVPPVDPAIVRGIAEAMGPEYLTRVTSYPSPNWGEGARRAGEGEQHFPGEDSFSVAVRYLAGTLRDDPAAVMALDRAVLMMRETPTPLRPEGMVRFEERKAVEAGRARGGELLWRSNAAR